MWVSEITSELPTHLGRYLLWYQKPRPRVNIPTDLQIMQRNSHAAGSDLRQPDNLIARHTARHRDRQLYIGATYK